MKMKKNKIEKDDGRYLIFYEFEDEAPNETDAEEEKEPGKRKGDGPS